VEPAQQHGLGSRSARAYLLTVLGELVLPRGGAVWTQTLLEALGLLEVDPRAARQAVNRAAGKGLLAPERHGRRTRWHLTPAATALLTEGTERIYSLHRARRRWDGRLVLCLVATPGERDQRRRLRTRLAWAGFGALAPGVWLGPWAERRGALERVLEELGLRGTAQVFVAEPSPSEDPRQLAAAAFDLPGLAAAYRAFVAAEAPRLAAPPPRDEERATAALLALVHRWRQLPFLDPDLPEELLPEDWAGDQAAACFHRLHDRLAPWAARWWAAREPAVPEDERAEAG
jgi:phenylacetic acid degradation operon negative regulatory protein